MRPLWSNTAVALALILAMSGQAVPALASDNLLLQTSYELIPEETRRHPKKMTLTLVASDSADLAFCELSYFYSRLQPGLPLVHPTLESGGKIKLTLKLIDDAGTKKVGKNKITVEARPPSPGEDVSTFRITYVGWADSPVDRDWLGDYHPKLSISKKFPLRVEPGDMLQWKLTFKGMPRVEADNVGEAPYWDELRLSPRCYSCGSADSPCPDAW